MRLIDARCLVYDGKLRLENIDEPSSLRYAILSHTWGRMCSNGSWGHTEDEILFADVDDKGVREKKRPAWDKAWNACRLALEHGLRYVWVDTCCFNKESSAELDESINAMFSWYEQSDLCLAYLADLHCEPGSGAVQTNDLKNCRWFYRGWTLQELLAPKCVEFYDQDWNPIGSKTVYSDTLSFITGIDETALEGTMSLSRFTIAQKMNWAARRETKRPEDRAYSLLGIFGVNMPLIYGIGGKRAFKRLQDEIIKVSTDLTIFMWELQDKSTHFCSMFADSPDEFAPGRDVKSMDIDGNYAMTNKGLLMDSATLRVGNENMQDSSENLMLLVGTIKGGDINKYIGVYLHKIGRAIYARDGTRGINVIPERGTSYRPVPYHQFYVTVSSQETQRTLSRSLRRVTCIPPNPVVVDDSLDVPAEVKHCVPESLWDYRNHWLLNPGWERKDFVLGMLLSMRIQSVDFEFAVLFQWHRQLGFSITGSIFNLDEGPESRVNSLRSIFSKSKRFDSVLWDDLVDLGTRSNYCDVSIQDRQYRITVRFHDEEAKWQGSWRIQVWDVDILVNCLL
ncbi:hypothetical protein F5Y15DRAFT_260743 [Xylariaceae sp. FL0016]|nr:hypothetical protein F5Y15DRAFT_260743 [Xylariaceae sp. FL0016]